MAEDKRTKIGATGPQRQTGGQAAIPASTPVPATTPPPAQTVQLGTSYLPPQIDPLLGQTLMGRYSIQKKLGEGGMGAVYLATHNLLDKQVALKILHGEFARKPDLVERFIQEAKAASRIRHENVIDISDFGITPEGLVFFAMELLNGHDLHTEVSRARLAGQLLPWSRSKKIFLQICAALAAAHDRGIIHRDLKPENVYLIDFLGDPDFVKLLDFGIAKMTEVDEGGRKLTKTGMLFGTPEYMSPEQARGENVDARVDVYAMGCILHQLVTGRVPFEADNFMGVLSMHLTEPPAPVPLEILDRISAPRELAAVIEKALAKDRNQRWSSIEELANAVRTASGDAPVRAGTPAPRAASVDAPPVAPRAGSQTGRQRTQWTGKVEVPTSDDGEAAAPRKKSKAPFLVGAFVVVAGGATAAMFALKSTTPASSDVGSASGGSAIASGAAAGGPGSAVVTSPPPDAPPAPELPPLPDRVKIKIDSKPAGAEVQDLSKTPPRVLGKTPVVLDVRGSRDPLSFALHLRGYGDAIVDLTPDKDTTYLAPLEKGASGGPPKRLGDPSVQKPPQSGSGAVTQPEAGSAATVKQPEAGSAATPPEVVKPPEPQEDDCPELPCTKKIVPGLHGGGGSGSGSGG